MSAMHRLINGMEMKEYVERDGHKVRLVDFDPSTTRPWNTPIGEENKTSHPTIVDGGLRMNKVGDMFHAWHSPSVVTERVPVESFVEFGIEQEFVWRRVKMVDTTKRTIKRKTTTTRVGEWDDVPLEDTLEDAEAGTVPRRRKTGHDVYLADKGQREQALDGAYRNYVLGITPSDVLFTHVRRHIWVKGKRTLKLANLRNEALKGLEDHLQDFIMEVLPKIEAKLIRGKLSHWLNSAFKNHFIDAQVGLTKEWDWRRFIAGLAEQSVQDVEWTESLQDTPTESLTGDDALHPEPLVRSRDNDTAIESASIPLTSREVPLWAMEAAAHAFLRQHPEGIERSVYLLICDGADGATIGQCLNISVSKVSRLKTKIEQEILELGLVLARSSE